MNHRPASVAIVSWIFIAFGGIELSRSFLALNDAPAGLHIAELMSQDPYHHGFIYVVQVLAVVGGVFTLRGRNWARWLLVVWVAFHVGLGVLHSAFSSLVHSVVTAGVVYSLFRPAARLYFQSAAAKPPQISKSDDRPDDGKAPVRPE